MSGRVKDYYWDQINEAAENEPPEPYDAEEFYRDMELERAKEVIRQSAARGLSKEVRHEPR